MEPAVGGGCLAVGSGPPVDWFKKVLVHLFHVAGGDVTETWPRPFPTPSFKPASEICRVCCGFCVACCFCQRMSDLDYQIPSGEEGDTYEIAQNTGAQM